ncbi:hypothetical protein [Nocardioides montaniterrae]
MRRQGRAALAGTLIALGALVSGCAGDASAYVPTGIDQLAIPTPSPQPGDFVEVVDNPWFPLAVGTRWSYRAEGVGSVSRVVAQQGPVIEGVATTALRSAAHTDYYAQDRAGNVWWFGRAGEWQVGTGVGAGLAMPAHPRRGDGFTMAAAGTIQVRGSVVDTQRVWSSPLGSSRDAVVVLVVEGETARAETFAPGLGLVADGRTGLVRVDPPRS